MTARPGAIPFSKGGAPSLDAPGQVAKPLVPKEWLKAHAQTKRWNASRSTTAGGVNANVGQTELRTAFTLPDGMEGMVEFWVIRGFATNQGNNMDPSAALLVDGVNVIDTQASFGAGLDQGGFTNWLVGGDGALANSWAELDFPLVENAIVSVKMRATALFDPNQTMGWSLWGLYWPVTLREQWAERGWRK